ncbi:Nn.00g039970.m01.CDS01 [Neocucurbitaria sp. VM-36]
MSNRTPTASMSSTSSLPVLTPSSTTFTFGEEHPTTPSFTFQGDHDRDRPLPSVETDVPSTSSRQSTPSTTLYTPSTSTNEHLPRHGTDQDSVLQQTDNLRNLRLTSTQSPERTPSQQGTPTPSIQVTPSAPPPETSQHRPNRLDSLVDMARALRVDSLTADSPGPSGMRDSRSPSPSHRRRSGSGINRETHRIENEEPPPALLHMPEIRDALANARTLTSRMVDVLSSSNLHRENDSSIGNLHQQAKRLHEFQLPSSRIVGLVGDSGVGKSSLINSLLDKIGLARASSSGTACTCAVTEYIFHDGSDFTIHVDYFSLKELKKQFEELLRAYRDYESLPENERNRNGDDEDDNDRKRLQKTAQLAGETFRASFREKLEQKPTVLSTMAFKPAVVTMVQWASQLLPPQGGQESFNTVEECSSRLRELTSEPHESSPHEESPTCWPFIQKIRVYLKAHILSKGLIIADLPGLRDLNSARKAITERYVRKCHHIFVVAKIDRAITNESIKEIFELADRANLSKIDVICTRSEDIHVREARHDWPAARATIEEMQGYIENDTKEIEYLKEEIEDLDQDHANLTREQQQELSNLERDYRKAKKSKANHEFDLRRHIVGLRNDKVSESLRERYRDHPTGATLRTFCVSNTMYEENREKPAMVALPYLNLSGILELRRYCIGIVVQSRLRATREYIKDKIPAFLGSVELWIEAGSGNASAEKKQQTLDAVSAIQRELNELTSPVSQVKNVWRTLGEEFDSQVRVRMGQSGPQWTRDATRASLYWESWHHSSYKAFCSKYGEHYTNAIGYCCWNEEILTSMKDDMSNVWDSFVLDLDIHLQEIKDAIAEIFGKALAVALSTEANDPSAASNPRSAMRTLATNLRHREDLTLHSFETAQETFSSQLFYFHTDVFSSIRSAFIGQLMENAYHAANMEYGTGSHRRRTSHITGRINSGSLFHEHRRFCKESFRDIVLELQDKLDEIVQEQLEFVEADLQILRDENVVLESERNPEFRRRVRAEMERVKGEVERLGRVVAHVP